MPKKKYTTGTVKTDKTVFTVKEASFAPDMVSIANATNQYEKLKRYVDIYKGSYQGKIYPHMIGTEINEGLLQSIITNTIGVNKIAAMAKNKSDNLTIHITFSPEGKPLEVGYFTAANTLITPAEFKTIEDRIKREIKASFNEKIYYGFTTPVHKTFLIIRYSKDIHYKDLLIN